MMNHPADPEARGRLPEPDVPEGSPGDRVPVVFLCAAAVWLLVFAALLLRLIAGQV